MKVETMFSMLTNIPTTPEPLNSTLPSRTSRLPYHTHAKKISQKVQRQIARPKRNLTSQRTPSALDLLILDVLITFRAAVMLNKSGRLPGSTKWTWRSRR
ncbi:hypothetical protein JAAARDRAFT_580866 [Jaapia argillacea MUCL 33604]|uniref:Uncharacterized protein n=1 Tax=Jaapia argillacea MUCL 33604 TaxID=933084 RepID=A0A067P9V5_9AGAM|nr:hypothetical protein JAAARDRAFT_580866 [Jaapia argillacea MUCL 33604]